MKQGSFLIVGVNIDGPEGMGVSDAQDLEEFIESKGYEVSARTMGKGDWQVNWSVTTPGGRSSMGYLFDVVREHLVGRGLTGRLLVGNPTFLEPALVRSF